MKVAGSAVASFLKKPDPSQMGVLIFGADPMRVAAARQSVIAALVGPQGEEEMRLTRIPAADLRKDPARLDDAIKAQSFFPGHRVAFVEDATDTVTKLMAQIVTEWQPGDAQVVITAGQLAAKSALRKLFEAHPNASAIGIYDNPPTRDEITATLTSAGLSQVDRDVMDALFGLAQALEPGDFRQTIEKVGLYKLDDPSPLTIAEVLSLSPQSAEVDVDDVLDIVTFGRVGELGPILRNLYAQGVLPVTLCIQATRHFKRLHQVASDPSGPQSGIGRLRPPVFSPRRD